MEPLEERLATPPPDEDDEEDDSDLLRDIEIVGLDSSTNGRSCTLHECCGSVLMVGDIIRLQKVVVDIAGRPEDAVRCVLIRSGRDSCTVGFIPKVLIYAPRIKDHLNKFAQIVEDYRISKNKVKREKSHRNCGVAAAVFLHDIPVSE